MMGIKPKNPSFRLPPSIRKKAAEQARVVAENILCYVGEDAATAARDHRDYHDQTGNLRSSIGYAVVSRSGRIVGEQKLYKQGYEGLSAGREMLDKLSKKRRGDVSLHIVAGMDYAEQLERKGYKVLSPARVLVDRTAKKMLEDAGLKVQKISDE
ncbi:MAG: hypothetical protein NC344_10180 [Bacteroidales bacterium]|nr:hypothetical protein [Bacteroidales bacterium]MCM1148171.1 hypothetical protein [Bacteroidales bacterium]MCM1207102.1 hypothetical protein [Bacillota bacterium]MCM1510854.1 hypothetical protein [Clostridium sp.]